VLRIEERLAFGAHSLAHCPQVHVQRLLEQWRGLRSSTFRGSHGGTTANNAWIKGEGIHTGEGADREVWARSPKQFPVQHAFYSTKVPNECYSPLDPYALVCDTFDDDHHDLHARAVYEAMLEGVTVIAAKIQEGRGMERVPEVLCQRFAATVAQGDVILLMVVLFAMTPKDVVAIFRHLLLGHLASLLEQQVADAADVTRLESTAWLACVACHCLQSLEEHQNSISPVIGAHESDSLAEVWAAAVKALSSMVGTEDLEQEKHVSLSEAHRNVLHVLQGDGRSRGAKTWAVLLEYFVLLWWALRDFGANKVAMVWTLRAVCDPSLEPVVLLRVALDEAIKGQNRALAAETVVEAAATLYKWMPSEEISGSMVRAALSARQLSTGRGGSSDRGGSVDGERGGGKENETKKEADCVLKDISVEQKLKVAKELLETGGSAPGLVGELLETVETDANDDAAVLAEAQRLRTMMIEASDTAHRTHYDHVVAALRAEEGSAGLGQEGHVVALGCPVDELNAFVAARAAAVEEAGGKGAGLLLVLAQMVCLWHQAVMPWCLHVLAVRREVDGETGTDRGGSVHVDEGDVCMGGSVLGRDLQGCGDADGGKLAATWMVLLRRALELRLGACAIVLRCGPARYALAAEQEEELLAMAERCVGVGTAVHFALLSPYPSVRSRASTLLRGERADGNVEEDVVWEWLVETVSGGEDSCWRVPVMSVGFLAPSLPPSLSLSTNIPAGTADE
jgi:hypothetical protein